MLSSQQVSAKVKNQDQLLKGVNELSKLNAQEFGKEME